MKKIHITVLVLISILTCVFGLSACNMNPAHTHVFDQKVVDNKYLVQSANCQNKATYCYSCKCGEMGTETFEIGEVGTHSWSQEWSKSETHHWHDCLSYGCKITDDYNAHSYDANTLHCVCGKRDPSVPTIGLNYRLNSDGASYYCSGLGEATETDIVISSEYEGMPVTNIGARAFFYCSSLTSITIPDSVTSIAEYAFNNCSSLTSIIIPDSVTSIAEYAFSNCSSLINITIPDGVTSISGYAFYNCRSLASITIPDSVTSIGYSAFGFCRGLTSIVIPDGVTSIGREAFYGCCRLISITIPDSVMIIAELAFRECNWLTIFCETVNKPDRWYSGWNSANCPVIWDSKNSDIDNVGYIYTIVDGVGYLIKEEVAIVIGQPRAIQTANIKSVIIYNGVKYSVTSIGDYAFESCARLTSAIIPDSVTSIGDYAFSGCSRLVNITIPESVTSIGMGAFSDCSGLISITIPDSVTSVGERAFDNCSRLTIYCEATSGWYGDWNNWRCPVVWGYKNNNTADDGYIYTVVDGLRYALKNGLAIVAEQSTAIQTANIKSAITYNGVTYNVTSICRGAFSYCDELTSVTIPKSVTSIGDYAFFCCSSLNKVYYKGMEAEWNSISIDSSYNEDLTSAIIYYHSETAPTTGGNYWHYDTDGKIVVW